MCFSATGSFGLSGVLGGAGVAALTRNSSPRRALFAALPLLFALQQVIEGVVWLAFHSHPVLPRVAVTAFVAVAIIVERSALTSVWCFFAAIVSTLVVVAVNHAEHPVRSAHEGSGNARRFSGSYSGT